VRVGDVALELGVVRLAQDRLLVGLAQSREHGHMARRRDDALDCIWRVAGRPGVPAGLLDCSVELLDGRLIGTIAHRLPAIADRGEQLRPGAHIWTSLFSTQPGAGPNPRMASGTSFVIVPPICAPGEQPFMRAR